MVTIAEHVLRGEVAIFPREEGGRQLLVNDTGEVYRIPLTPEVHRELLRMLTLSDEELRTEINRQAAASKLVVAGADNGRHGSSAN